MYLGVTGVQPIQQTFPARDNFDHGAQHSGTAGLRIPRQHRLSLILAICIIIFTRLAAGRRTSSTNIFTGSISGTVVRAYGRPSRRRAWFVDAFSFLFLSVFSFCPLPKCVGKTGLCASVTVWQEFRRGSFRCGFLASYGRPTRCGVGL